MTKQEAIDELHKHYVPEYVNYIVTALTDGATPSDAPTINAISIPEDATNGDVIKAVFPNIEREDNYGDADVYLLNGKSAYTPKLIAFKSWWNAKYKGVR